MGADSHEAAILTPKTNQRQQFGSSGFHTDRAQKRLQFFMQPQAGLEGMRPTEGRTILRFVADINVPNKTKDILKRLGVLVLILLTTSLESHMPVVWPYAKSCAAGSLLATAPILFFLAQSNQPAKRA